MKIKPIRNFILGFSLIFGLCGNVYANILKPLGFELGKTTMRDFQSTYPESTYQSLPNPYGNKNEYYKYPVFGEEYKGLILEIHPRCIGLPKLKNAEFYFNYKELLCKIYLRLSEDTYSILKKQFTQKYILVKEERDRVLYQQNGIYITLESAYSSTNVIYQMVDEQKFIRPKVKLNDL